MKNKIKILLLACLLALSMCIPAYAEVVTEYNGYTADDMKTSSEQFYQSYSMATEEDIDGVIAQLADDPELAECYENLKNVIGDIQNAEFGDFVMETVEDSGSDAALSLKLTLLCGDKTYYQTVLLDDSFQIVSFSYDTEQPQDLGSVMAKAGMNTLLGMGIVFLVLILISFLISLFKYLPGSGYAKQKALEQQKEVQPVQETPAPAAAAAVQGTAQPADDTELIAVISAAVAAAMGTTTTDGFVVRSIKKRKW